MPGRGCDQSYCYRIPPARGETPVQRAEGLQRTLAYVRHQLEDALGHIEILRRVRDSFQNDPKHTPLPSSVLPDPRRPRPQTSAGVIRKLGHQVASAAPSGKNQRRTYRPDPEDTEPLTDDPTRSKTAVYVTARRQMWNPRRITIPSTMMTAFPTAKVADCNLTESRW